MNFKNIQTISLELFNSITNIENKPKKVNKELLPFIVNIELTNNENKTLKKLLMQYFYTGKEIEKVFATFKDMIEKDTEEILINQILNYIGNYGNIEEFKNHTISSYKVEELLLPINIISFDYFKKELKNLLSSNIAINNKIIDILIEEIINIFTKEELQEIINNTKNKEIKLILIDKFNILPSNPEEFLKYIIYIITNNTMIIKNKELLYNIRKNLENNVSLRNEIRTLLYEYINIFDIKQLASIFNRYKHIFIELKKLDNKLINKISRLSKKYHKPKKTSLYLEITNNKKVDINVLKNIINTLDTSYLIKIGNALLSRLNLENNRLYRIRNGKIWNKEYLKTKEEWTKEKKLWKKKYNLILEELRKRIIPILKENNISIKKDNILKIALPTSGKKMLGNKPFGSYVDLEKYENLNIILGIYWENYLNQPTDLDLSLTNAKEIINWQNYYNYLKDEKQPLSSGDMTDAPEGATEQFLIRNNKGFYFLKVNFYNDEDFENIDMDFKFFIAATNKNNVEQNTKEYFQNSLFSTNVNIKNNHVILGYYLNNKFYFDNIILPSSNIANKVGESLEESIINDLQSKITFNDLIEELEGDIPIYELSSNDLLNLIK